MSYLYPPWPRPIRAWCWPSQLAHLPRCAALQRSVRGRASAEMPGWTTEENHCSIVLCSTRERVSYCVCMRVSVRETRRKREREHKYRNSSQFTVNNISEFEETDYALTHLSTRGSSHAADTSMTLSQQNIRVYFIKNTVQINTHPTPRNLDLPWIKLFTSTCLVL